MTSPATAAVPSEEDVARLIDPAIWVDDLPTPTTGDILAFHQRRQASCRTARAILALFAPILAEWREIANAQGKQRFANLLRADAAEARALAAEAALSKLAEGIDFMGNSGWMKGTPRGEGYKQACEDMKNALSAIRAQGE